MISAGWPLPATMFTSRPSAIRFNTRPSGSRYPSIKGLRFSIRTEIERRSSLLISTSKCPALARMALCFIRSKWGLQITSLHPVAVTNTSPKGAASAMGMTR